MRQKRVLCALLCAWLVMSALPSAQAAGLRASIATGKITLNGQVIDNSTAEYPMLVYQDITYFPMTFYLSRFLGLTTEWDAPSRTLIITRTGGVGDYMPDTGHSRKSGSVSVTRADYAVIVNDKEVDNSKAEWPVLNYGAVTYFPLTWAFAVDAFGWDYHWDTKSGLVIDSSGGTPYVTPPIVNPDNPPISTGERSEAEIINGIMRAWSPTIYSSSPENLTVEVSGEWSLAAIKAAIGAALRENIQDASLKLTDVSIAYSFQFPASMKAGDVLKVPYTASYEGAPQTLPSGKSFTPSGSAAEAIATVRLGRGWQGAADTKFQAGQELYRRLEECAQMPTLTAVSGSEGYYDPITIIRDTVNANLETAGLPYRVGVISSGSYVNSYWTQPGYSQTLEYTISFSPKEDYAPADPLFEVTAQCILLTVEK